ATAIDAKSRSESAVGAELLVGYIPVFQFAALYATDLEISPGPPLRMQGRVHTNGDLYLNGDGGPLAIGDDPASGVRTVQVSSAKALYRDRQGENRSDGAAQGDAL